MTSIIDTQIESTLSELFLDSKNDFLSMMTGAAKGLFRPMQPADFKNAYLSISKGQGQSLTRLIEARNIKNIVEFGTSFGISTLYLALGVIKTGGNIITTELIESKADQALINFKRAGVSDYIDLRIGDAMETLSGHNQPIDLLLLDGWKDLYLGLFKMLEDKFHSETIIYVDNADMTEVKAFLKEISSDPKYRLDRKFLGKVVTISIH